MQHHLNVKSNKYNQLVNMTKNRSRLTENKLAVTSGREERKGKEKQTTGYKISYKDILYNVGTLPIFYNNSSGV